MDLKTHITALADFGAGWVLWLLVGLSILALAIVFERLARLVFARANGPRMRERLLERLAREDVASALAELRAGTSFESRIVAAGLSVIHEGASSVEHRMRAETTVARHAMERGLSILGTIGNNAPFIGLLGTVIGVVRSFAELDSSGGRISASLMSEIGEALVATAVGLLVALPAVACFNYFHSVVRARLVFTSAMGDDLASYASRITLTMNGGV